MSDTSEQPEPIEKSLFEAPPIAEQERMVEAILFASAEPVTVSELSARMPHGCDPAEALVYLRKRYEGRGVHLVRVGDAYAFRTAPDLGQLMRKETIEQRKLSRAAIETLAIVAYHQPVTRAEIEEIRGVAVSRGTVDQLLELDWIRLGRRRMTPGRPVTFVVTEHFLDHFGLESARDLPGLKELRASGLLDNRALPGSLEKTDDETEDEATTGQSELLRINMNVNQIINMVMRVFIRKGVNWGINKGIGMASRRGKAPAEMTADERQTAQAARQTAQRARKMARIAGRLGR